MRNMTRVVAAVMVLTGAGAAAAEAGIMGKVSSVLSGEVLALIASTVVALLSGAFGLVFVRVSRTFSEAGEFLTALGTALDDRRITREELAAIIREGREVFTVWK